MKISKGMYIRYKDNKGIQYIRKIVELPEDTRYGSIVVDKDTWNVFWVSKKKVLKSSFNIIDLIEVGDYVNGVKVTEIKDGKPYHEDYNDPYFSYYFEENNIKDIVTKEQFNACKYVVERDNYEYEK